MGVRPRLRRRGHPPRVLGDETAGAYSISTPRKPREPAGNDRERSGAIGIKSADQAYFQAFMLVREEPCPDS
jgi:hypothetical protein